jgi:hypothetical protein
VHVNHSRFTTAGSPLSTNFATSSGSSTRQRISPALLLLLYSSPLRH